MKKYCLLLTMLLGSCNLNFAEQPSPMPTLIINSITNYTQHDLIFYNKYNHEHLLLKAHHEYSITYPIEKTQNIMINGSMLDCMRENAQFQVAPVDENDSNCFLSNYGLFLNMHITEGGINDGSNIISGQRGSFVCKSFIAGLQGGCKMSSQPIKVNKETNTVLIDLKFFMDEKDIKNNNFKLQGDFQIVKDATDNSSH